MTATTTAKYRASTRPTWAEVSFRALSQNFRALQKRVDGVEVCCVVKADAYGHGAVACATALEEAGAKWFGVTTTDEAIPLRESGIQGRVLLMTGFWHGEEDEIVHRNLTANVWERWHVEQLDRAAARLGMQHKVHLKVDTGMGRLGVGVEQLPEILTALKKAKHLELEGLGTHFASSEVLDAKDAAEQARQFERVEESVKKAGFAPALVHMSNSAAVVARPEAWKRMVRPGLALYGYLLNLERSGAEVSEANLRLPLKPVLTWKTRILSLRDVPAGKALGYNGTYVTKIASRIAALPLGYADGLNRRLSNQGRVIIRDHYAPIVGRVSMDLTLVDVSGIEGAGIGDEVIVIGQSKSCSVDAWEHAKICGTIPYEILCAISKRVPRKYGE